jgi:uncharacterized damage-inducible protein DinB
MAHPLVEQLRFTRYEFMRGIQGVSIQDGSRRLLPMNCIAWNVGHLAWQEQRYFLVYGQGLPLLLPEIDRDYAYGCPPSEPSIKDMLAAWRQVTAAADPWLDSLTSPALQQHVRRDGKPIQYILGNLLQRVIYHYWYHLGENLAIRQQLGHTRLPQFVGNIDRKAPYQPD